MYQTLNAQNREIVAKGQCLSSESSQTVAGLLATNVHHTGCGTFYHDTVSITVLCFGPGGSVIERTLTPSDGRDFRFHFGTIGYLGVIVEATFQTVPLKYFRDTGDGALTSLYPAYSLERLTRDVLVKYTPTPPRGTIMHNCARANTHIASYGTLVEYDPLVTPESNVLFADTRTRSKGLISELYSKYQPSISAVLTRTSDLPRTGYLLGKNTVYAPIQAKG